MKKVNLLLLTLLSVLCIQQNYAQGSRKDASVFAGEESLIKSQTVVRKQIGYWAVGGQINAMNYFGDLNPLAQYVSTDISKTRPSFAAHVVRKWSPRIHTRLSFAWGRLTGDDSEAADPNDERHRYRYMRNAHFRNDIFELALTATYDLRASNRIYYNRKHTPYLVLGVGVIYHNPKARTPEALGGKWEALRPLGTEGQFAENAEEKGYAKPYSLFQPVVPVGFGMRFRLNDRWDLSVEMAVRMLFTDYLDDVSDNYANPNDLTPLARIMANRTLEQVGANSGVSRVEDLTRLTTEVNPVVIRTLDDGTPYPTISGFGWEGDKRGESAQEDIYVLTGFHLTYIVEAGLRCPKFGKRRRH